EIERRLAEQHAVLDRWGPRQHSAPRRLGGMRMHDAAPPMCLGLAAGGSELVLGERRPAAFADALRAEDLDHVGPARDALLYGAAPPVRVARLRRDPVERGDHPRAGDRAARDRVAQLAIERRADALNCRDPRAQRAVGVFLGVEDRLLERL